MENQMHSSEIVFKKSTFWLFLIEDNSFRCFLSHENYFQAKVFDGHKSAPMRTLYARFLITSPESKLQNLSPPTS